MDQMLLDHVYSKGDRTFVSPEGSETTFELDPNTLLPLVSDGYFWKIKSRVKVLGPYSGVELWIKLRAKKNLNILGLNIKRTVTIDKIHVMPNVLMPPEYIKNEVLVKSCGVVEKLNKN